MSASDLSVYDGIYRVTIAYDVKAQKVNDELLSISLLTLKKPYDKF
jgi:hypothetical protein